MVFCLGALVALPLIDVDITVRAAGVVRPAVERIELKAAVSGRIARVFVKDNESVKAGQALIEVSTRDLEERLSRNRALQVEKGDMLADLSLLTAANAETGGSVLDAGRAELTDGSFRTLESRQSYLQVRAQLQSGRVTLAKARADLGRLEMLASKELVTKSDLDAAQYSVRNAEAQELVIIRQALNNWKTSLRTEKIDRDNLITEERRMVEELTYATVRAPADGAVQGFLGFVEGGYLVAGQSLGSVSPDAGLLVETAVSPRDIGLIRTGQTARLQIDAFPYTQWGLLDARVEQIAGDAMLSGQQLYFRVLLKPQKDTMSLRNGVEGTLRKGMTLSARFVVNRRSLLQALYENTADWINPQHGGSDAG